MMLKDTSILLPLIITISCSVASMADSWDPADDTGAGATSLPITESLQAHGPHTTTNLVDDADWFSFHLEAGKRYRFESVGSSDTHGNLYSDSLGNTEVLYEDYRAGDAGEGGNFQILYTPMITQDYFLMVTEDQSGGSTAYSLEYVNEPSFDGWDPDDDSSTNATLLSIDSTLRMHGPHRLGPEDHYDWFEFNLVEGVEYTFESTGPWDTVGSLYNDALLLLDEDDTNGEGLNFIIIYTPTNSGGHYIRVTDWTPGLDIDYTLQYYISGISDSDGDGMLDAWEIQYFGGTNVLPNAHGDTDQFTNLEEYISGTDPTNSDSFFAVTHWLTGSFVVQWPSVADREYAVLWAESLTNDFVQQGLMIDHPQNSYTDTIHTAESSGFYKVKVQLK